MQRKTVWLIVICVVVLSLVLASYATAAPTAPTVPTAPITPTLPTAPTTPIAPATPVAPSTETPKYGGQLAIAPLGRWTGFDLLYRSVSGYYPIGQTNETLLSGDWAKGPAGSNENDWATASPIISHMTGYLAESWELPDAETIIIHLRKGIHWALNPRFEASRLVNGREVVANDIVYTIVKTYTAPGAYLLTRTMPEERPVSTTASDKYTVIIKTQKGFLGSLFQRVGSSTGYWPSEPREKYGDMRDWKSTVGSGPFMIEDYVDASTITLIRNPNYWQKNPVGPDKGNQLPYVDGVKIFSITDKSTRAAAFRTGKLDHLGGRSGGLVAEDVNNLVQSNPGSMTKALAGAAFGRR
ncbi:MAG: hypothetical protein HYU83_01915 [Chloroflexi bacterium]|nr:hypothetical protein [Chloroflexota bacterium]